MFGLDDLVFADFLPAIGSAVGGFLGYSGAQETNSANRAISADQMAFQERMSNTSYQRAKADMQAAGLNPALMYSRPGASTPVGSSATMVNAAESGISAAGNAAGRISAMQTAMLERENLRASNAKITAEADAAKAQADVLRATVPKIQADTITSTNSGANLLQQTENLKAMIPKIAAEIENLSSSTGRNKAEVERTLTDIARVQSVTDLNDTQRKLLFEVIKTQPFLRELYARQGLSVMEDVNTKRAILPGLENIAAKDSTAFGAAMPYINDILKIINTAAGLAARGR